MKSSKLTPFDDGTFVLVAATSVGVTRLVKLLVITSKN